MIIEVSCQEGTCTISGVTAEPVKLEPLETAIIDSEQATVMLKVPGNAG